MQAWRPCEGVHLVDIPGWGPENPGSGPKNRRACCPLYLKGTYTHALSAGVALVVGGLSTTPAEYRRSRGAQPRALRNVPAVVAYRGGATLVAGKPSFLVFPYQRQAGPLGQKAPLLDIAPPTHGSVLQCVGALRRTRGAGPWFGRPRRSSAPRPEDVSR